MTQASYQTHSWIRNLMIYEPGRPLEEVARDFGLPPDELIKLASNENLMGPSPRAVKAMQEAAGQMHFYPDGGCFYLRRALSERLGVPAEQILPGNGSNELIELLGHAMLGPGTSVVMSQCAFIVYKLVAALFQAETIMLPQQDFTHDLEAMADAVRDDTRIVFVANPNNPTGTMVDGPALDAFIGRVPEHVLIVIDEAYIELLDPAECPDTLAYLRTRSNVCILRTFSKAYGLAGVRLGYALCPPGLANDLNRVRQPFNVNAMAQAGALAALEDEDYLEEVRQMVRSGLEFFPKALDAIGVETVPAVTNFMLARVGEGRKVFEALQRRGVITRPVDGYGLPEYIRITLGRPEQNRACVEALTDVLNAKEEL